MCVQTSKEEGGSKQFWRVEIFKIMDLLDKDFLNTMDYRKDLLDKGFTLLEFEDVILKREKLF